MAESELAGLPAGSVVVRFYAAARAAAGTAEDKVEPAPSTLGALLAVLAQRYGPDLDRVLARCSFLVDEVAAHGPGTALRDGVLVDVLPPFAGG